MSEMKKTNNINGDEIILEEDNGYIIEDDKGVEIEKDTIKTQKSIENDVIEDNKNLTSDHNVGTLVVEYARRLANEFRVDDLLLILTDFARELVKSDRATIWIIDKTENEFFTKTAQGLGDVGEIRLKLGTGAIGYAVDNDEKLLINDAYNSPHFNSDLDKKTGYKTECLLAIPIKDQDGKIIGVVQTINKMHGLKQQYTQKDLDNLEIVAPYISTIIEKIQNKVKDALITKRMSRVNNIFDEHISYLTVDEDFIIQKVSTSFLNIFETKEDNVKNKPLESIIVNEDRVKFKEAQDYIKGNRDKSWANELEFIKDNKKNIWMRVIVHSESEQGRDTGFTFLLHDLSDKKLAERLKMEQMANKKYDKGLLEFMGSVSSAVLMKASRGTSILTKTLFATMIILLSYASIATLDELARAEGKVITTSSQQLIQNLEGGVIKNIFVKEGDIVKKGDSLVQLSEVAYLSSLNENNIKLIELKAKLKRLDAEANDKDFELSSDDLKVNNEDTYKDVNLNIDMKSVKVFKQNLNSDFSERILSSESQLYLSDMKELNTKIQGLREQVKQKNSDVEDQRRQLINLRKNYIILEDEIKIKRPLVAKGIFSSVELYGLEKQLNDMDSQYKTIQERINSLKSSIKETNNSIEEMRLGFQNSAKIEYNQTLSEIASLQETQKMIQDKLNRTLITSPIDGMVKELNVKTVGGVIQSGKDIMSIIPIDDRLICEIKLKPEDIAKVYIGQPARLKLSAYDSNMYGSLNGEVVFISPDSTTDERAQRTYYIVHIEAEKNYLGDDERFNKIKSGMIVSAEMVLGQKSILDFILKPIFKDSYTEYTEH